MNQEYIQPDPWCLIEEGFDPELVKSSESLFSIGNGAMGQRANFEETYTGPTFQGSYIAGVYYPDKTRVGWWKNGYPEYFAKVLNAPNWIGIDVRVDGVLLDLFSCKKVTHFRRELNMKEGWYRRSFQATLPNDAEIAVQSTRFLHLEEDQLGAISYEIKPLQEGMSIEVTPFIDAAITNQDSNWDDPFWKIEKVHTEDSFGCVISETLKTQYGVGTFMEKELYVNGKRQSVSWQVQQTDAQIRHTHKLSVAKNETVTLYKFGGYVTTLHHEKEHLIEAAKTVAQQARKQGFNKLLQSQTEAWRTIWDMADITISGDVRAQQGIRFNIFQLNQTYLGKDARLNIGPKGFTGEKYGGSTYWDTEAYCLPFYMATKGADVARTLLEYRYHHLSKAIENAEKLGFSNGAALYPMVTMNGEESHNEWEITFEEIHRNGAIAFAIFNYERFTGDTGYLPEMGLEVLIGIARFWKQRFQFSEQKQQYVMLGVTGPNEYENNVNNNWYTNFIAKWCLLYASEMAARTQREHPEEFERITKNTQLTLEERNDWETVASQVYFPYSEAHQVYLQQDGFLDKDLRPASSLSSEERPINQHWSWDRILRSPYIKQADVLQGFYFFEDQFSEESLQRHFDFYEPLTVHESSLSPCVHSIQAARLGRMEQAYEFYLRTSRLDLDDYNREVEEGCHITSMAGTWMSIVEGFGGMRVKNDTLYFQPRIPKQWDSYAFKINFRGSIIQLTVSQQSIVLQQWGDTERTIWINEKKCTLLPNATFEY
ncbi:family 65 glycosyl hydrolase domain-containing protein [Altibacter sp. HG106]|uniref:family 65 glycosyl hydrolase domain-containing protein n=1 Tax=Altibacter sp. HG106 TaxID=3023937 RepID=UPI002351047E|nr:family 65 glycosyl hydrolase domain-containing protein [Altibacter sp. HG106]MDC7995449.1 family 65 glycosyl hydrolase domain-containing protein [Altibacter sp. HG106]